jgi:hypothetical protein
MNYPTIASVFIAAGISRRDFDNWFIVSLDAQVVGQINGLPTSRGILRATNGILCLIEQPTGWFEGHLQHFVPDDSGADQRAAVMALLKQPKPKKPLQADYTIL